jgi:hypothetical protein
MFKGLAAALVAASLVGCASYQPIPEGYKGPIATVSDSGFSEDGSKAQLFALVEIDGNHLANSFGATAQASSGQGFRLTTRIVDRQVPAAPMKVLLRGSHTTAAPIHAMMSQAAGTFFSVEGTVAFSPKPNGRYTVKGELKKESSSVWIEDTETNQPVTDKVVKR